LFSDACSLFPTPSSFIVHRPAGELPFELRSTDSTAQCPR
jgi:hypothetical protein